MVHWDCRVCKDYIKYKGCGAEEAHAQLHKLMKQCSTAGFNPNSTVWNRDTKNVDCREVYRVLKEQFILAQI